jgi:hypothetical protein
MMDDPLTAQVYSVWFTGENGDQFEVTPDPGEPSFRPGPEYPHWLDLNLDGDTNDADEGAAPVGYVRNGVMEVKPYISVSDIIPFTLDPMIRGSGPDGINLPATYARAIGPNYVTADMVASVPFGNAVNYYPEFTINWEVAPDFGLTWIPAGSSSNELYVSLAAPTISTVYHTYIYLSVAYSVGATTEAQIIADTWAGQFPSRTVKKIGTNEPLNYYKEWNTEVKTGDGLLAAKDGKCMAWTQLFLNSLASAGLQQRPDTWVVVSPKPSNPPPTFSPPGLVIKDWNFNGAGSNTDPASNGTYPYYNQLLPPDFDHMKPPPPGQAWSYTYGGNIDVTDAAGIPGQNTSNPHSLFGDHVMAKLDGKYYDPSYGRLWDSVKQFEDTAVAGFYAGGSMFPGTANQKVVHGFRKNINDMNSDLQAVLWTYNSQTGQTSNKKMDPDHNI